MEPLEIFIHRLADIPLPGKIAAGDWIDLIVAKTTSFKAGDFVLFPLGFSAKLPRGYEAHILPRSSTFKKYGLLHASSGLIDESYCGDNDQWLFGGYATRDGEVRAGIRICQFRIVEKMDDVYFFEVDTLGGKDRGGFGSTGE